MQNNFNELKLIKVSRKLKMNIYDLNEVHRQNQRFKIQHPEFTTMYDTLAVKKLSDSFDRSTDTVEKTNLYDASQKRNLSIR